MKKLSKSYWDKFKVESKNGNGSKYDGLKFENLINELLSVLYGKEWVRTGKSHDDNRDFWTLMETEDGQNKLWAECKNYRDKIALDILAPTLVMAQIYGVNTIIFFSRSQINTRAKNKILLYGEKTGKRIIFYDADILEDLIINNSRYLSPKYCPDQIIDEDIPQKENFEIFFFQDPILGTVISDDEFINYRSAIKIHYNEFFTLLFVIKNPTSDKMNISLSFSKENPDRFCFEYMDANIHSDNQEWCRVELEKGEGKAIPLNLRPILFKSTMQLPRFDITILTAAGKNKSKSEVKKVKCAWVGQTKLIGSSYEKILDDFEEKLLNNRSFSCLLLSGTSGTGKSRILSEIIGKGLKQGYRILNLTATENFSSLYLIQEIICFIYEVPKTVILSALEEKIQEAARMDPEESSSIKKVLQLFRILENSKTDHNIKNFIDDYGSIIFERLSNYKYIILIDNIQFTNEDFQYFIEQYAVYAANQSRYNYSVLAGAFNLDYMTSTAANLLFNLLHLGIPHILPYTLSGFRTNEQGILFLRELIHTSEKVFDPFFEKLIDQVSLKPYYLYQGVRLLEESNVIKQLPHRQGYLFTDLNALDVLLNLPNGIADVLKKRWKFISDQIDPGELAVIFSALYLFERMDDQVINTLQITRESVNFLCSHSFIKRDSDDKYEFEHDIIRNHFETYHRDKIFESLAWINQNHKEKILLFYKIPKLLYYCCIKEDPEYVVKTCTALDTIQVPNKLSKIFFENIFYACLNAYSIFEHLPDWISAIHKICINIREYTGSSNAADFYKKAYEYIFSIFPDINMLYSTNFRKMIHSYCDILVESHQRSAAESLIQDILGKGKNTAELSDEALDEKYVLQSIMLNREYVAYNNSEPTEEVIQKRKKFMQQSRDYIKLIKDPHKKGLIQYLNDSDEGYNYYGFLKDKERLFSIWDRCIGNIPEEVPEKTMNYYRKLVQYDLINQDSRKAAAHIASGREYLKTGEYSHEPMIFNTFFMMAEAMDKLQHTPCEQHYYIRKLIDDILQIQLMLNNGKIGDIMLIKGVDAYYNRNADDAYYSFYQAFTEYRKKQTSRFWIKLQLLYENIQISFTELNIYGSCYNVDFLPDEYRIPLTRAQLKEIRVSGIQQTSDGKMNLPLI